MASAESMSHPSAGLFGRDIAPYEAFYAGLGDQKIVTTLCPGGKERMRRLRQMIARHRVDLSPLVTHRFALDSITDAFELFSHQRDEVLKVALYPEVAVLRRAKPRRASPNRLMRPSGDSCRVVETLSAPYRSGGAVRPPIQVI